MSKCDFNKIVKQLFLSYTRLVFCQDISLSYGFKSLQGFTYLTFTTWVLIRKIEKLRNKGCSELCLVKGLNFAHPICIPDKMIYGNLRVKYGNVFLRTSKVMSKEKLFAIVNFLMLSLSLRSLLNLMLQKTLM